MACDSNKPDGPCITYFNNMMNERFANMQKWMWAMLIIVAVLGGIIYKNLTSDMTEIKDSIKNLDAKVK